MLVSYGHLYCCISKSYNTELIMMDKNYMKDLQQYR